MVCRYTSLSPNFVLTTALIIALERHERDTWLTSSYINVSRILPQNSKPHFPSPLSFSVDFSQFFSHRFPDQRAMSGHSSSYYTLYSGYTRKKLGKEKRFLAQAQKSKSGRYTVLYSTVESTIRYAASTYCTTQYIST